MSLRMEPLYSPPRKRLINSAMLNTCYARIAERLSSSKPTWMKAKDFGPLGRTAGVRKRTTMNLRKKTHPTTRLIEAMLDLALLAGFISAMGFLVRLAF